MRNKFKQTKKKRSLGIFTKKKVLKMWLFTYCAEK